MNLNTKDDITFPRNPNLMTRSKFTLNQKWNS